MEAIVIQIPIFFSAVACIITYWPLGVLACRFFGSLFIFVTMTTTWTLSLITWYKHRTIAAPLNYNNGHGKYKRLLGQIIGIWCFSIGKWRVFKSHTYALDLQPTQNLIFSEVQYFTKKSDNRINSLY